MKIIAALRKEYPGAKTALHHSNPFQLLVATILSAQSTDTTVNRVTPGLFKKFPTPHAFATAEVADIAKAISSINFYNNKARNIKGASCIIAKKYGGRVPDTMDQLLQLPGVARKTANVVLSQAFGKNEGIVVDTHVRRLSQRLGLTKNQDPIKIETDLMRVVPRSHWGAFSFLLISHGRAVCTARNPRCCNCLLESLCPSSQCAKQNQSGKRRDL